MIMPSICENTKNSECSSSPQDKHSPWHQHQSAFTLVELLVVIVIAGLLASIAVPKFIIGSHRARASECQAVLKVIDNAQDAYRNERGLYYGGADFQGNLNVIIPESRWFTYSVTTTDGTDYVITGEVKTPFGDAAVGDKATLTHTGVRNATGGLAQYIKW